MAMAKIVKLRAFTEDTLEDYVTRWELEHRTNLTQELRTEIALRESDRLKRFKQSEDMPIRLIEVIIGGNFITDELPARVWNFVADPREWCFKGWLYKCESRGDSPILSDEEIQLLILDDYDKERRKFEQLRRKFLSEETKENSNVREPIPESVRIAVWRRDDGKCVKCGSREKLEYDHIIPVSQGGGNTARNIELLCEKCNREKSNKIQ